MGVVPSGSGGVPQTRKGQYNRVLHPAKLWTVSEFILSSQCISTLKAQINSGLFWRNCRYCKACESTENGLRPPIAVFS